MTRTVRYFWITGTAAAALLVPTRAAAMPDRPAPEPDRLTPVVQIVEVPIDDTENEATQVVIAAALGAAVAAAAEQPAASPTQTPVLSTSPTSSRPDQMRQTAGNSNGTPSSQASQHPRATERLGSSPPRIHPPR
jgi:hypothetical protein